MTPYIDGVFASGQFDHHPWECGGEKAGCPHCLRAVTPEHSPSDCGLCEADQQEEQEES